MIKQRLNCKLLFVEEFYPSLVDSKITNGHRMMGRHLLNSDTLSSEFCFLMTKICEIREGTMHSVCSLKSSIELSC